jgi:hypothetical protein
MRLGFVHTNGLSLLSSLILLLRIPGVTEARSDRAHQTHDSADHGDVVDDDRLHRFVLRL